jgi:hypothetical protein
MCGRRTVSSMMHKIRCDLEGNSGSELPDRFWNFEIAQTTYRGKP